MCGYNQLSNGTNESNSNITINSIRRSRLRKDYPGGEPRENNIIQIDLPDGSTKLSTKRKRTESAESQ